MTRYGLACLIAVGIISTACSASSFQASPNVKASPSLAPLTQPLHTPSTLISSPLVEETLPPIIGLKPGMGGLIDKCGDIKKILCSPDKWAPPKGYENVIGGIVVNTSWGDLQTSFGGPLSQDNVIDKWITRIRTYNKDHPNNPIEIKVRIYMGENDPAWVKKLNGDAVMLNGAKIARFWGNDFLAAMNSFMSQISTKYDSIPEINDFELNGCTISSLYPLLRPSDNSLIKTLLANGFTSERDKTCLQGMINSGAFFLHTHVSISVNPYVLINNDGSSRGDENFTESMISYCVTTLNSGCVIENNPVHTEDGKDYDKMCAFIKKSTVSFTCQIGELNQIGNLAGTIQTCINYNANSVELPTGYTHVNARELAGLALTLMKRPH